MREKIAERIYTDWNKERGLEWKDLPDYRKNAYRDWVDDYILKPQCEEIEKGLLTNEEIRFLRDAANVQENKLLLGNTTILSERAVAQAQLQKILALLK